MAETRHYAHTIPFDQILNDLLAEVEAGSVAVVSDGDLRLFKYTDRCSFERRWTRTSLAARGLILDVSANRIVGTSFEKFFNIFEGMRLGEAMEPLPDEPFEVFEKIDGSLGIVFFHDGEWRVATRGSFQSDQARWATDYLRRHIETQWLEVGCTYLTEIVFPENRIVISYDYQGLVLLGAYDATGEEFSRRRLEAVALVCGFTLPESHSYQSIDQLLEVAKTLPASAEGFVVRFASGRRIKIKGDEYCRIHRLVSRVTPLAVWEMLVEGDDLDAIATQLPEEFQGDLAQINALLDAQLTARLAAVRVAVDYVAEWSDKEVGLWQRRQHEFPEDVARWIFAARKKDLLKEVGAPGSVLRRRFFETFRPTANRLEGYVPSSAVNRFAAEQG